MLWTEYQEQAFETAIYPDKGFNLWYPSIGLLGEIYELLEALQTHKELDKLESEMGDILWYISALSIEIQYNNGEKQHTGGPISRPRFCEISMFDLIKESYVFQQAFPLPNDKDKIMEAITVASAQLAGNIKRYMRDDETNNYCVNPYFNPHILRYGPISEARLKTIKINLSQILAYLRLLLASYYAVDTADPLEDIAEKNINKLLDRKNRNTLKGEGGNR